MSMEVSGGVELREDIARMADLLRTSGENGFPAVKSHCSGLKQPGHPWRHPDTNRLVRTPSPLAISKYLISE